MHENVLIYFRMKNLQIQHLNILFKNRVFTGTPLFLIHIIKKDAIIFNYTLFLISVK